jgi:hypothetical protein
MAPKANGQATEGGDAEPPKPVTTRRRRSRARQEAPEDKSPASASSVKSKSRKKKSKKSTQPSEEQFELYGRLHWEAQRRECDVEELVSYWRDSVEAYDLINQS